jgi:hypothetical protein
MAWDLQKGFYYKPANKPLKRTLATHTVANAASLHRCATERINDYLV